jgi:hypothetical protein
MKNFTNKIDKALNEWLPIVWGYMLVGIITGGSITLLIWIFKMVLKVLGVIA